MITALLVALAGGLGAAARFHTDALIARMSRLRLPVGTLTINTLGSLLLGLFSGWVTFHSGEPEWASVAGTGFCGGFTTFSSFSLQTLNLLRDREWLYAGGNILLSVVLCLLATWLGFLLGSLMMVAVAAQLLNRGGGVETVDLTLQRFLNAAGHIVAKFFRCVADKWRHQQQFLTRGCQDRRRCSRRLSGCIGRYRELKRYGCGGSDWARTETQRQQEVTGNRHRQHDRSCCPQQDRRLVKEARRIGDRPYRTCVRQQHHGCHQCRIFPIIGAVDTHRFRSGSNDFIFPREGRCRLDRLCGRLHPHRLHVLRRKAGRQEQFVEPRVRHRYPPGPGRPDGRCRAR